MRLWSVRCELKWSLELTGSLSFEGGSHVPVLASPVPDLHLVGQTPGVGPCIPAMPRSGRSQSDKHLSQCGRRTPDDTLDSPGNSFILPCQTQSYKNSRFAPRRREHVISVDLLCRRLVHLGRCWDLALYLCKEPRQLRLSDPRRVRCDSCDWAPILTVSDANSPFSG